VATELYEIGVADVVALSISILQCSLRSHGFTTRLRAGRIITTAFSE